MTGRRNYIRDANVSHYGRGSEIESYLNKSHHKLRIQRAIRLLRKALPAQAGLLGLELASGTGKTAILLEAEGWSVLASDASKEVLNTAESRGLKTECFDASEVFPFQDESFDFVFAGELIEHLFDVRLFLTECCRVLKSSGVLVLTTPNLATPKDRIRFLFGKMPRQINPFHEYLYLHIRPFTAAGLKEALEVARFRETKIFSHFVEIDLARRKIRSKFFGKVVPSLGKSLISVSRK